MNAGYSCDCGRKASALVKLPARVIDQAVDAYFRKKNLDRHEAKLHFAQLFIKEYERPRWFGLVRRKAPQSSPAEMFKFVDKHYLSLNIAARIHWLSLQRIDNYGEMMGLSIACQAAMKVNGPCAMVAINQIAVQLLSEYIEGGAA